MENTQEEFKESQKDNIEVQFDKIRDKLVGNYDHNRIYYQGTSRLSTCTPIPNLSITQQKKVSSKSSKCSPQTYDPQNSINKKNNDHAIKHQIKQLQQMATGIAAYHKQQQLYKRKYQTLKSCKYQNRNYFKNPLQQLNEEIRCIDSKRNEILLQISQYSAQLLCQTTQQHLHHDNSKNNRMIRCRKRFVRNNQNIVLTNIKKQQNKDNYMGQILKICQDTKQYDKMLQMYIKEVGEISIETRQHPIEFKKNSKIIHQNRAKGQYSENSIPDQFMKTLNSSDYSCRRNRKRSQSNQLNKMKQPKEMSGCWTPDSTPRSTRYGLSVGKICTKIRQIESKCESKRETHKKSNRLFSKRCFNRHSPNNNDSSSFKNMIKYM